MKFSYKTLLVGGAIGWVAAMLLTKYWVQIKTFFHSLF